MRFLVSLVVALSASCLQAETARNLTSAKQMSARLKKPVFIQWRGNDCPICDAVESQVIRDRRVSEFLDKRFVRVSLNADHFPRKVTLDWNINTVPTTQVVKSDWKVRRTLRNTLSPQDFLDQLQSALDRWGER